MGQPGYSKPQPLSALVAMLQGSTSTTFHHLWADDISVLDAARFHHPHIHGPGQLTDLYLLGLAVKNAGRFVTFDARISLSAVHGARPEHLVTL
jgi:hypothetical protein